MYIKLAFFREVTCIVKYRRITMNITLIINGFVDRSQFTTFQD